MVELPLAVEIVKNPNNPSKPIPYSLAKNCPLLCRFCNEPQVPILIGLKLLMLFYHSVFKSIFTKASNSFKTISHIIVPIPVDKQGDFLPIARMRNKFPVLFLFLFCQNTLIPLPLYRDLLLKNSIQVMFRQ